MCFSGDLQDKADVQGLNHWIASREPSTLIGKIILDASLPSHGFDIQGEKLYLGVASHQYLQRFLAGRGVRIEATYLQPTQA